MKPQAVPDQAGGGGGGGTRHVQRLLFGHLHFPLRNNSQEQDHV